MFIVSFTDNESTPFVLQESGMTHVINTCDAKLVEEIFSFEFAE